MVTGDLVFLLPRARGGGKRGRLAAVGVTMNNDDDESVKQILMDMRSEWDDATWKQVFLRLPHEKLEGLRALVKKGVMEDKATVVLDMIAGYCLLKDILTKWRNTDKNIKNYPKYC